MKSMLKSLFLALSLVFVASCGSTSENPDEVVFGIDVSHYQDHINWDRVVNSKHPVEFAIVRATMGKDRKDKKYEYNTEGARDRGLVVGAYHYYDPNENSRLQAENFLQTAKLLPGDIRPVLDVERMSRVQPASRLRVGVKRWLDIVEEEYGVKPILYTSLRYWQDYLRGDDEMFAEYPLWIAAYSEKRRTEVAGFADILQFSENVRAEGIRGYVDGNDVLRKDLTKLRLK